MTAFRELGTVMLTHDLPDAGLCADDIGAIVQLYSTDAVEVAFVTASGRTQAPLALRGFAAVYGALLLRGPFDALRLPAS